MLCRFYVDILLYILNFFIGWYNKHWTMQQLLEHVHITKKRLCRAEKLHVAMPTILSWSKTLHSSEQVLTLQDHLAMMALEVSQFPLFILPPSAT